MRSAVLLMAAVLVAASASLAPTEVGARPPPQRRSSLARPRLFSLPAREAESSERLTTLKDPGSDAILIRAGTFVMGSDELEIVQALALCKAAPTGEDCPEELFSNEYAAHEVYLSDYWIDRTEVTVGRYRLCVTAGRCSEPPYASGGERFDRPSLPVILVTWQDAAAFCAWMGGRLPTEAEWERAARGLTGRRYPWGQVYNPTLLNHGKNPMLGGYGGFAWSELDSSDGFAELAPVGSFPEGRTLDGLEDLAGNVEEWVNDYYAPELPKVSAVNPIGPDTGDERVVKGGSYLHGRPALRSAVRGHEFPTIRRPWRGFRCVHSGS